MYRRDFNVSLLKTAAAILAPRFVLHTSPYGSTSTASLYANAIVIDSLCAPFADVESSPTPEQRAAIRQSGITAINFTISAPDFEGTLNSLANVQKLVDEHPDQFLIVRRHSDLARCKREGKMGLMLGFQQT